MSSGDTVAAENYLQHAEHYNRIILAAQAQNMSMPGMEGQVGMNGAGRFNQPEFFQRDFDGDDDGEFRGLYSSAAVFSRARRLQSTSAASAVYSSERLPAGPAADSAAAAAGPCSCAEWGTAAC